jgi:sulfite exporter TauE/SafE
MEITSNSSVLAILAIGFVIGLYHAVEADHLAAVSAIVSERKSAIASSLIGGLWGLGHTLSLFIVGGLVIFLKLQISESLEAKLEAIVGVMLVALGANAIRKLFRSEKIHVHQHEHGGSQHVHLHAHEHETEDVSHHGLSPRSLFVGMVHGLAGSAGLMLIVVPTIESPMLALAYILIFGVGSIAGMMLMSMLMSVPLVFTANRFTMVNKGIRVLAGLFSLIWGVLLINEKLIQG